MSGKVYQLPRKPGQMTYDEYRRRRERSERQGDLRERRKLRGQNPNTGQKKKTRTERRQPLQPAAASQANKYLEPPPYRRGMGRDFYLTREWRHVRWQVLRSQDNHCVDCGRGREHGIVLHVDHVKSRHQYPELELDIKNLAVRCEDCNIGKGKTSI